MSTHLKRLGAAALAVAMMGSCATQPPAGTAMTAEERDKAKRECITHYTVVGSLGGALIGLLTSGKKNKGGSAALGAVAGGALGAALAWGHCMKLYSNLDSYPVADAQATAQRVGYKPSKGNLVKIQDFRVDPASIAPGKEVQLAGTYYLMAPDGAKEVKVTETRTVSYYDEGEKEWKELGSVDSEVTSALGTRKAEGRFELPVDVPDGRYRIALKVASMGKTDEVNQEIVVRKA